MIQFQGIVRTDRRTEEQILIHRILPTIAGDQREQQVIDNS